MSDLIKAILRFVMGVIKGIFRVLGDLIGELLPIILLFAVAWFFPAISAWMTSVLPSWMGPVISGLSTAAEYVVSAGKWIWGKLAYVASAAWTEFAAASLSTQLMIAGALGAAIAPEEFTEVVKEAAEFAGELITTVISAASSGLFSSPLGAIAIGVGLWWLLSGDSNDSTEARLQNTNPGLAG